MQDCCYNNLEKAKYISRATWVCPICGKDVSLAYVLLQEAIRQGNEQETKK